MKVLLLAAGYGTRLYPLITNTPKPLLSINDKPLLEYILDKLRPLKGLKEIFVVSNNKFYTIFQDWAKKQKTFPAPIRIVNDQTTSPEDRLGSIGDIDFVLKNKEVEDDLVVIGGDNLFDYSLEEYCRFSQSKIPAVTIGLYDIGSKEEAKKFGVVSINEKKEVISFEEKPAAPKSSLVGMCCYYIPKGKLSSIAQYLKETNKGDRAGDYIHWLFKREKVFGFTFQGKWYDIGSIEAYKTAQEAFKS